MFQSCHGGIFKNWRSGKGGAELLTLVKGLIDHRSGVCKGTDAYRQLSIQGTTAILEIL